MSRHRFLAWAALFAFAALSSARAQDVPQSPAETLVMIDLTSDPVGADINIDDAEIGLTPMTVKLKPGKHAFRMFMNDYQNWVQWITIEAGADLHIKATLTKSAQDSARRTGQSPPEQPPPTAATTQTPPGKRLTNVDVVDMLNAGLSQEIVIAKIKASACEFDTAPTALKALKAASVPDTVILAIVQAPSSDLRTHDRAKSEAGPANAANPAPLPHAESNQNANDNLEDCRVRAQNEYDTKMNVIATMTLAPVTRVAAGSRLKQNLDAELRECRSQYELASHSAAASHP